MSAEANTTATNIGTSVDDGGNEPQRFAYENDARFTAFIGSRVSRWCGQTRLTGSTMSMTSLMLRGRLALRADVMRSPLFPPPRRAGRWHLTA